MLVFQEPIAARHDTGLHHPERAARLDAVASALLELDLQPHGLHGTDWADPEEVIAFVQRLHERTYVARFRRACETGRAYLDVVDCTISPDSFAAAAAAAGCALAAADAVMRGPHRAAFSAMRPPGHHAEADRAMGFCFFNNVALAAERLLVDHGLQRVAIVDFDVHHGNGTQHLFEARGDVLYISTHQHPATLYPGTGYEWERGARGTPGEGCTINIPLRPGCGHGEALRTYESGVIPALEQYRPEALLLSAGFDADERDPLAALRWRPQTFEMISGLLAEAAASHCGGRIVTVLEGGYDTGALSEGLKGHLSAIISRING
ncbi:MAG: histone deacetylase [Phycisphaerales bacterium]|nr:histone deacetylase [Phycisphaerales bacterium]